MSLVFGQSEGVKKFPRKANEASGILRFVPQTDTGSQVENTKALERFVAKELGKIVL